MKAVVMAGGEGSRLRPMTVNRPKPLVPVANRPIMEHILRLLKAHGIQDVVCTLFYLSDEIMATFGDGSDLGLNLIHSIENTPLGTAGAVKLADEHLKGEPFVIISGDALTSIDLGKAIQWHKEKGSKATLVLKRVPNPLEFGVVITDEQGHIQRFLEKPAWSEVFSDTVNTGIYILEPEVLDLMEPGRSYDWSQDIFPRMLASGEPIFGYICDEYWSDIGALSQYREAQVDVLSRAAGLEVPGVEIEPGIWIGENVHIEEGADLRAPVVIGDDVRIKAGAVIGPNTSIGKGCLVDSMAVVRDGVVWEGCYIGQGVAIEGAIVCSRCTIKKDSILKEEVVVGDSTLVDVGCTLKARVKVWPDKVIERGSTLNMSLVSGHRWRGAIFRELGVAGLSNIEVTPEFATRIGLAYGTTLPVGARVVTGRDSTRSSRMTKRSVIASLLSTGCTVIDMRSAPLPVTRHHARVTGAHGAISVRKMPGSSRMTLIEFLDSQGAYVGSPGQRKIESNFFREEFRRTDPEELGVIDVATRAVEMYETDFFAALGAFRMSRRLRVVVDYGFSSISPIFPAFLNRMGIEAISINAVNDAKAAPRTPEQIDAHLRNVTQIAGSLHADLGVLFVNEGERMILVDDQGIPLEGKALLGAMATLAATSHDRPVLSLTVTASDLLEQHLASLGATVHRSRVGARGLMSSVQKHNSTFGGDEMGGFIFPKLTPGFDAMFGLGSLLGNMEKTGAKLSDAAKSLPEFFMHSDKASCPFDQKGLVMRVMAEELAAWGEVDLTDGIKSRRDGAWVLILPDSFEPVVHIWAEADSQGKAVEIVESFKQRVQALGTAV